VTRIARVNVAEALGNYLDVVDSCAPGLVEGLYVVGSFALDDWHPERSDIDIVAVTADAATDEDAGALRAAHALLAETQPRPAIDGAYVAWGDLTIAPASLHRPWTLDGEFHHDSECFELNPVTWYVLKTYGVTVRGPSASDLVVDVDVEQRTRFVVDNLVRLLATARRRHPRRGRGGRPRHRRRLPRVVHAGPVAPPLHRVHRRRDLEARRRRSRPRRGAAPVPPGARRGARSPRGDTSREPRRHRGP
jgi:hypothetical protein